MKRVFLLTLIAVSYGINASDQEQLLAQMMVLKKDKKQKAAYEILADESSRCSFPGMDDEAARGFFSFTNPGEDYDEYIKENFDKKIKEYKNFDEIATHFNEILEGKEQKDDDKLQATLEQLSMCGGINYTMTVDEMKKKVQEVFSQWEKEGLIISEQEFEKIKANYFPRPMDLDRLWGALYLKKRFETSEFLKNRYDVPNFIIVRENIQPIQVTIFFGSKIDPCTPLNQLELQPGVEHLKNAKIYFENIPGSRDWVRYTAMGNIGAVQEPTDLYVGYDDFTTGNIQRYKDKNYVVDTEKRSMKMPPYSDLYYLPTYLKRRFQLKNPGSHSSYPMTIELLDLR